MSESWREFFEDYRPGGANLARPSSPEVKPPTDGDDERRRRRRPGASRRRPPSRPSRPGPARRRRPRPPPVDRPRPTPPRPAPGQARPPSADAGRHGPPRPAHAGPAAAPARPAETATPLRGAAGRIVANMTASLGVPTATSFRVVPARLLEVNRRILNNQLSRTGSAGKVSFTHLIGFAVVEALQGRRRS